MSRRIYVASSWRNERLDGVVGLLRALGHEVYDFREDGGFAWSDIDPNYELDQVRRATGDLEPGTSVKKYRDLMAHPIAQAGFERDFEHMKWADTFVMVLPCGKSAHLETGWASGQLDVETFVLLEDPMQPELMYGLLGTLCASMNELAAAIGSAHGEKAAA